AEEAVIAAFMRHVPGGVDVNQQADSSDKQQPDTGEWVEQESDLGFEVGGVAVLGGVSEMTGVAAKPGIHRLIKGMGAGVSMRVLPDRAARHDETESDHSYTHGAHGLLLQLLAEEEHERRAEGGQQRDEIDLV